MFKNHKKIRRPNNFKILLIFDTLKIVVLVKKHLKGDQKKFWVDYSAQNHYSILSFKYKLYIILEHSILATASRTKNLRTPIL